MGADFVITDFPTVVGVFGLTAISGIVCGYTKIFIDVLKCPFGASKEIHTPNELHSFWTTKFISVFCSSVIVFFSYIMQDIYNLNSDNLYNELIEHFHHRVDAVFLPLMYGAVLCLLLLPFYAESIRKTK